MMIVQTEETFACKECGNAMNKLPGSIQSIYICPKCGFSAEEDMLFPKKKENTTNQNDNCYLIKRLFTDQFMLKYTQFANFSEFLGCCKFVKKENIDSICDVIDHIPKRKWNAFIRKNTCFQTWDQMFEKAVELYLKM
ncbi:MAG: hypothetical protein QCH96_03835 [Candidatus Thermoplasmatota archaeon]|nr:hypothetical protein [Candidatus Thermoplasmatota archaeon]